MYNEDKQPSDEAVAYRYKEGHASWENENPWVPTTLAHGAVLLERKVLAANGTFKGDERDHYLALAVDPLYLAPPTPDATRVMVPRESQEQIIRIMTHYVSDLEGMRFTDNDEGDYYQRLNQKKRSEVKLTITAIRTILAQSEGVK